VAKGAEPDSVATGAGARLPGPTGATGLGLMRRLLREPQPVLDELRGRFGPICGLGWGPARMAVVGEPGALRELFATSTDAFRWGHKFNALGFVVGPGSMIVSDGADHHRRRGSVQGAFARRRLNGWIPMIVERTDCAVERLADELARAPATPTVVDLYPAGRRLVLEVVVRALFGEALATRSEEIGDLFQRPQDYLESPALRPLPHPFPHTRRSRVREDRRALDGLIDQTIADRRDHPTNDPADVLEALVQDGSLSDAEIRDQVVTLIGAGFDTTSASLAWMVLRASSDPAIWAALRVEADGVLGSPGGRDDPPGPAELARLELADRVVRETLRLHPAGVIAPREAAGDLQLRGYRIPKGTLILWSAYLAGRDPEAWDDPLRFDPDRLLDATPEQRALADQAWVPFGGGTRNCIGFALARMELTLMIARLAQRIDVSPIGPLPPPIGMVVNRPRGGAPARVALRS